MNILKLPLDAYFTVDALTYHIYSFAPEVYTAEVLANEVPHMHHYIEFFYIYSGELSLMLSDTQNKTSLCSGDICMIPQGVYHEPVSSGCMRLCFQLSLGTADNSNVSPALTKLRHAVEEQKLPLTMHDTSIISLMDIYRSTRSVAERASLLLSAALCVLSKLTPASPTSLARDITRDRRRMIEEYISTYFGKGDGLSDLAREMCLTERRTSEVVREIMGKGFKELVVEERMTVAKLLIGGGRHTLEEISHIVGYSSYSGFYTAYKKFYGTAPAK